MQSTSRNYPRVRSVSTFTLLLCLLLLPDLCDSFTEVFSIAKDSDDTTYLIGNRDSNFFIGKKSPSCILEWESTDGSTSGDDDKDVNAEVLYDAVIGKDGFVYAVGSTRGNFSSPTSEVPNLDAALLVYNPSNGDAVLQKQYDITADLDNVAQAIVQKADGTLLVAVYGSVSNIQSSAIYETRILEIDPQSLKVLAIHEVDVTTTETLFAVSGGPKLLDFIYEESSNSIIAVGNILGRGIIWQYSLTTGSVIHQVEWGEAFGNFQISGFTSDGNGAFFVVGSSSERVLDNADLQSTVSSEFHAYVIRYDNIDSSSASATWVRQLAGVGSSQSGSGIAIDPVTGEVVVVGDFDADFTVTDSQTSSTFSVKSVTDDGLTDVFLWYLDPSTGDFKELKSSSAASTNSEDRGNTVAVLSTRTVQIGGITNDGSDGTATVCDESNTQPSPTPTSTSTASLSPSPTPSITLTPSNTPVSLSLITPSASSIPSGNIAVSQSASPLNSPSIISLIATPSRSLSSLTLSISPSLSTSLEVSTPSQSVTSSSPILSSPPQVESFSTSSPSPSATTTVLQSSTASFAKLQSLSFSPIRSTEFTMLLDESISPSLNLMSEMASTTLGRGTTSLEPSNSDSFSAIASSTPEAQILPLETSASAPKDSGSVKTTKEAQQEITIEPDEELTALATQDIMAVVMESPRTPEMSPLSGPDYSSSPDPIISATSTVVTFQTATPPSGSSSISSAFGFSSAISQDIGIDGTVSPDFSPLTASLQATRTLTLTPSNELISVDPGMATPPSLAITVESNADISASSRPSFSSEFVFIDAADSSVPSPTSEATAVELNSISFTPSATRIVAIPTAFSPDAKEDQGYFTVEPGMVISTPSSIFARTTSLAVEETPLSSVSAAESELFSINIMPSMNPEISQDLQEAAVQPSSLPQSLSETPFDERQRIATDLLVTGSISLDLDESHAVTQSDELVSTFLSVPDSTVPSTSVEDTDSPNIERTPILSVSHIMEASTPTDRFKGEEDSHQTNEMNIDDAEVFSPTALMLPSTLQGNSETSQKVTEEGLLSLSNTPGVTTVSSKSPELASSGEIEPGASQMNPLSNIGLSNASPSVTPEESSGSALFPSLIPSASLLPKQTTSPEALMPFVSPEDSMGDTTDTIRPTLSSIAGTTTEGQGDFVEMDTSTQEAVTNSKHTEEMGATPLMSQTGEQSKSGLGQPWASTEPELTDFQGPEVSQSSPVFSNDFSRGTKTHGPSFSATGEEVTGGPQVSDLAKATESSEDPFQVFPTRSVELESDTIDLNTSPNLLLVFETGAPLETRETLVSVSPEREQLEDGESSSTPMPSNSTLSFIGPQMPVSDPEPSQEVAFGPTTELAPSITLAIDEPTSSDTDVPSESDSLAIESSAVELQTNNAYATEGSESIFGEPSFTPAEAPSFDLTKETMEPALFTSLESVPSISPLLSIVPAGEESAPEPTVTDGDRLNDKSDENSVMASQVASLISGNSTSIVDEVGEEPTFSSFVTEFASFSSTAGEGPGLVQSRRPERTASSQFIPSVQASVLSSVSPHPTEFSPKFPAETTVTQITTPSGMQEISKGPVISFIDVVFASATPSSSARLSEITATVSPSLTVGPSDAVFIVLPSATPSSSSRTTPIRSSEPSSTSGLLMQTPSASASRFKTPSSISMPPSSINQSFPTGTLSVSNTFGTTIVSPSAIGNVSSSILPSPQISETPSTGLNPLPLPSEIMTSSRAPATSLRPTRTTVSSPPAVLSEAPTSLPSVNIPNVTMLNPPMASKRPKSTQELEYSLLPSIDDNLDDIMFSMLPSMTQSSPVISSRAEITRMPRLTDEPFMTEFATVSQSTEAQNGDLSASPPIIPSISGTPSASFLPRTTSTPSSSPSLTILSSPGSEVSPSVDCVANGSIIVEAGSLNKTRNFQRVLMVIQVAGPRLTKSCQFTSIIAERFTLLSAANTMSQPDMWHITSIDDGPPVWEDVSNLVAIEQVDNTEIAGGKVSPSPSNGTEKHLSFEGSVVFNVTAFMDALSVELASGPYVEYVDSQNIVKVMSAEGFEDIKWTGMVLAPFIADARTEEEETRATTVGDSSGEVSAIAIGVLLVMGIAGFVVMEEGVWTRGSGAILPV